jgi:hypothetical protein
VQSEPIAKYVQKRGAVVEDLDDGAVDVKLDQWISGSANQLKEDPQPQVRDAFGLVTWNPAPCRPSS